MVIYVQKRIGQVVMYIIRRMINSARSSYAHTILIYPPVLVRLHACTSHSMVNMYCVAGHIMSMVPVQIIKPLRQSQIHKNQTVTFSCHLSHNDASVTWLRDGVEIAPNTKYTMTASGNFHLLKITDLELNDEAVYTLKIHSSEKASSAMLFLEGL